MAGSPRLPELLRPFSGYLILESLWSRIARNLIGALALVGTLIAFAGHMLARDNIRWNRTSLSVEMLELIDLSVIVLAYLLCFLAIAMFSSNAYRLLAKDTRKPVVFLRSFAGDVRVGTGPERALERAVRPLGPLVAIGEPGERVPPVGAARLYVTHDRWKDVVQGLTAVAQLVIMRIGQTEGFWWELQQAVADGSPEKLLIFVPPADRGEKFEGFRQRASPILPKGLPDKPRGLFIAFRDDWTPYELSSETAWHKFRRWILSGTLAPAIRESLRGRFLLKPMPFGVRELATIVFAALFAFSVIAGVPVDGPRHAAASKSPISSAAPTPATKAPTAIPAKPVNEQAAIVTRNISVGGRDIVVVAPQGTCFPALNDEPLIQEANQTDARLEMPSNPAGQFIIAAYKKCGAPGLSDEFGMISTASAALYGPSTGKELDFQQGPSRACTFQRQAAQQAGVPVPPTLDYDPPSLAAIEGMANAMRSRTEPFADKTLVNGLENGACFNTKVIVPTIADRSVRLGIGAIFVVRERMMMFTAYAPYAGPEAAARQLAKVRSLVSHMVRLNQ